MGESRKFDELSNEQMRAVDSACIAFEQALHSNKTADIEKYLESVSDDLQTPVFQELLAIELEWFNSRSLEYDIEDYLERFPHRHDEIHELVNAGQVQSSDIEGTGISTRSQINRPNKQSLLGCG